MTNFKILKIEDKILVVQTYLWGVNNSKVGVDFFLYNERHSSKATKTMINWKNPFKVASLILDVVMKSWGDFGMDKTIALEATCSKRLSVYKKILIKKGFNVVCERDDNTIHYIEMK